MKKLITWLMLVTFLVLVGCVTHTHQVGNGAQGNQIVEARQWYVLFGLAPLNTVDTNQMAGEAQDYEIKTEITVLDFIFNMFTSYVTVTSRTVTVKK
ncbi:MAG: hypothetical protein U9P73_10770 [Candidatus Cloacimonadota bacterium]|nr:hypothetical protein [Candidatus Cloacimonadota bacterium]